jgi:hypothetical protein
MMATTEGAAAPETPAARTAAKIMARRIAPGESGEDAGLRDTPYPPSRAGGYPKPKKKETPEELNARLTKAAEKFEAKKAKARLYARRHYRKKNGIPEKVPPREQKPPRKRPALADAILALEAEREELTEVIEILRRYSG